MRRTEKALHVHGEKSAQQLSVKTWPAFEKLFSTNKGVWGGCWCVYFHETGTFEAGAYDRNRRTKLELVKQGGAHGTIVFCGSDPVGWCEFGPREELPRIDAKKGYKPTADNAWRITCLFITRGHRKMGFADLAVRESVATMKKLGVGLVEAYPVEGKLSASFLWSGTPELFEHSGFGRVGPLSKRTWIYSLALS